MTTRRLATLLRPSYAVIAVATFLAMYPLLPPGIPSTADGPLHLIRSVEFDAILQSGVLYPRWAPDLAYGYGYPLFNYYAPLFYYLAYIPHVLGVGYQWAFKLTLFFAFLLYAFGAYWWVRPILGEAPAVVASVAYVYVPFRFHEAYMQGDYPQFLALGLAPFAFGALARLFAAETVTVTRISAVTIAFAAIVLTHNISALWLGPTLASYAAVLAAGAVFGDRSPAALHRLVGRLIGAGLAALFAVGLTAFFWLPALGEQNLVQLYRLRTEDYDVRNSFLDLATLLAPPQVVDQTAANPPPFLHLGWGQLALALGAIGLFGVILRRERLAIKRLPRFLRTHLVFGWALLTFSAFLTLPVSTPFWHRIPLIAYTQFPWRVLELSGLATALLAGIATRLALEAVRNGRWSRLRINSATVAVVGLALFVVVTPSLVYLYPRTPFLAYPRMSVADVTAFERNGGAVGTTSTGEYYPRDVTSRPTTPLPENLSSIGRLDRDSVPAGSAVSLLGVSGHSERYAIRLARPATLRFDLIRFDGWQVYIDGALVPTGASPGQGLLLVDAPAGSHTLTLDFADTPIRRDGWLVAGATALAMVVLGIGMKRRTHLAALLEASGDFLARSNAAPGSSIQPLAPSQGGEAGGFPGRSPHPRRVGNQPEPTEPTDSAVENDGVGGTGGMDRRTASIVGVGFLALLLLRGTNLAPYAAIFARQSPLDRVVAVGHSRQVRLEDQVEFLGYDVSGTTVHPGGSLTVTLYWRALRPLDRDYRSLAMIARVGDKGLLTQDDRVHPGGIPTSTWRTDHFVVDQHTITVPPGAPPMVYQLQVALYDPKTGAHLRQDGVSGWEGEQIVLQQVHVTRSAPLDLGGYQRIGNPVFGGNVSLLGYRVNSDHLHPGDTLDLSLVWQADHPIDRDYTIFTHLVDANQKQVAGNDSQPIDGQYPTSTWLPGDAVVDTHAMKLPANLPAGQYHLAFGIYDAKTLQRLDVVDKNGTGPLSQIDLDFPIHVEARP